MSALTLPSAPVTVDTVYAEAPHGHRVPLQRSHVDTKQNLNSLGLQTDGKADWNGKSIN